MKQRPWILITIAAAHIIAPFINFIFDAYVAGVPLIKYIHVFFQPYNFTKHWFHFVGPMLAGIAIYICRRWSYVVYVVIMSTLGFMSYLSFMSRSDLHNPWPLIGVYVINILIVTYFFLPAVRNIYFDPRLRWWETSPRYNTDIECQLVMVTPPSTDLPTMGSVINLSQTGLFMKTPDIPVDRAVVRIQFTFEGLYYDFQGHVIQHGKQNIKGFGVQFMHNAASKVAAVELTSQLQARGLLQADRVLTREDTFMWWVRQVLRTGKGLIPRSNTFKK